MEEDFQQPAQVEEPVGPFDEFVDNKADNKDKVTEIRKGYYPLIARIVLVAFGMDFLALCAGVLVFYLKVDFLIYYLFLAFVVKTIAQFYFIFNITLFWSQTYFQFKEDLLVKVVGVYNPQQSVYNLHELSSVEVHINFMGRLLKYGHLSLIFKSFDGGSQKVEIPYAIEPGKLKDYLSRYLQ